MTYRPSLAFLMLALAACGRHAPPPAPPVTYVPAPPVGSPEPEITRYLEHRRALVRESEIRIKRAKRGGDDVSVERLREERARRREAFLAERDRLTERDDAMVAAGATAIGLGGLSVITSGVLGLAYMFSGIFSPAADNLKHAAIGTAAGGLAGLSSGIPLLVLGVQRTPRSPPSREGAAGASEGPASGATLHVAF